MLIFDIMFRVFSCSLREVVWKRKILYKYGEWIGVKTGVKIGVKIGGYEVILVILLIKFL